MALSDLYTRPVTGQATGLVTELVSGLTIRFRHVWTATDIRLRDGARVRLREAFEDGDDLRAMFYTLSDASRYMYFCAGVPQNTIWADRVAQLGCADGARSFALVAEAGGKVIGVARFDRNADGERAEIGILLTDAWQSRGLGGVVLARLRDEAMRRGLSGFTATTLGENKRMIRLLVRAFPHAKGAWSYGQGVFDLPFIAP